LISKILLLSDNTFILSDNFEGDPLSPPKGEAAQGGHLPDPLFFAFFSGFFSDLLESYPLWGMQKSGGDGSPISWNPQECKKC
jgi:hypothetical protein